jgi:hypothetical protein
MLEILKDVHNKLTEAQVAYMLTGSFAMNYYAEPRMTRDIDIVIEASLFKKQVLFDIFCEDYYISDTSVDEALQRSTMFNVIHQASVTKIDLIIRKADEYSHQAFSRRRTVSFDGIEVSIISKEDLIISKILWSRDSQSAMQKADIINLLESGYDTEYVTTWLRKCSLMKFAKEFLGERYIS